MNIIEPEAPRMKRHYHKKQFSMIHDDVEINENPIVRMNHLTKELASAKDMSLQDAKETIRILCTIILQHTMSGRSVFLPSLGRFVVTAEPEQVRWVPYHKKKVVCKARWKIAFKPSSTYHQSIKSAGKNYFDRIGEFK